MSARTTWTAPATRVVREVGWGRVSVIHFDAHADTGEYQFGSLGIVFRRAGDTWDTIPPTLLHGRHP